MDNIFVPIELARTLLEYEDLEGGLRGVVRELLSDGWQYRGSRESRTVAGRPGWWWKVQFISWAGSSAASERSDPETLRGFRMFLRDLDEDQVCLLVETLLPRTGESADVA